MAADGRRRRFERYECRWCTKHFRTCVGAGGWSGPGSDAAACRGLGVENREPQSVAGDHGHPGASTQRRRALVAGVDGRACVISSITLRRRQEASEEAKCSILQQITRDSCICWLRWANPNAPSGALERGVCEPRVTRVHRRAIVSAVGGECP